MKHTHLLDAVSPHSWIFQSSPVVLALPVALEIVVSKKQKLISNQMIQSVEP
jgi:hypothetical protein